MKPVTRLFLIATGWTLASYMASSFIGAWFWDIGTGLTAIITFYAVLFAVMIAAFGMASKIRGRMSSPRLMAWGIVMNVFYLGLLLGLKTKARDYYIPLALLEGLSASFYWLALFVLAASWVETGQASWYNAWTGTLEAVLGLVIPPLSGWLIASVPGISGYRIVFALALASLVGSLGLIIGGKKLPDKMSPTSGRALPPAIPGWRRLLWSFWALGMRDGMYFFVPNLLLYIVTRSTLVLGLFVATQAALEGLVFWGLTRWSSAQLMSMGLATVVSALAVGIAAQPLTGVTIFVLGIVVGVAYPPYKVALESAALADINQYSRHEGDRIQLTGIKEVWINTGRLMGLALLLGVLAVFPRFPLVDIRWILGGWVIWPMVIWWSYRNFARQSTAV